MTDVPFTPHLDRVILKRPKYKKVGSLHIPEEAQKRHSLPRGIVVAVGDNCSEACKSFIGREVIIGQHSGGWLDANGIQSDEDFDWYIIGEDDILGVINET